MRPEQEQEYREEAERLAQLPSEDQKAIEQRRTGSTVSAVGRIHRQRTFNPLVLGSSPSAFILFCKDLRQIDNFLFEKVPHYHPTISTRCLELTRNGSPSWTPRVALYRCCV